MSKCGGYKNSAEWAKKDPEGLIKAMNKNPKAAKMINTANPSALKKFMGAVGRDAVNPFGWIGGEVLVSTMFSAEAEARGKTPLEALDEGVLWFLPKRVIDAQKKALFGYEGAGPAKAFKMKGYAGAYNKDQIEDMKNYLDMEDSDRKYEEAKDKRKNFETMRYDSETGKKRVLDNIDATIKKHETAAQDSVTKIYERNTGLRTDGTPTMKDFTREEFGSFINNTAGNLWDVQKQYALDEVNRGKQGELNTLYANKEDIFDVVSNITNKPKDQDNFFSGFTEEGQIPWLGKRGRISTTLTDPIDMWRASDPFKSSTNIPGVKQIQDSINAYANIGKISQEEKEKYAIEQGREDLLHKEYNHPIYGSSLSYDQMSGVFPEYFKSGGRVSYFDGGIVSLKKKW